ncbi:polycystic kidney disease protein 1-like 3 [Suncus etruscus]|uniref:polycystic kidney disease protein 1-like 3 n=1 Tax=Suncus etruscus TaxID=109475 RepID=UPI002110C4FA|nr:polycystic kidney disease protein 1-like 3 [Suncus etruscus]
MFFRGSLWLWLYIKAGDILGMQLSNPEPHGKNNCYQLNRFHCNFDEAENYCYALGGELAYTWNQEVQGLIWDFLEKGKKWWTGKNLLLQEKRQSRKNPDVTHQATKLKNCTYISRTGSQLWSDKDWCTQKHYFICQADTFLNQDTSYKRNGNNSHLYWSPEKTKREITIPKDKRSTDTHLSNTCHLSSAAHINHTKTLCHPKSTVPLIPLTALPPRAPSTVAPNSWPDPRTLEPLKPASGTPAEKAPEEPTSHSSPTDALAVEEFTALLHMSFQNVSDQALDAIAGNLSKRIRGLQTHSQLQRACGGLQKLMSFLPRLSESAQVNVIRSFIHLNKQLLLSAPQNCSDKSATVCLFHSLHGAEEAGQDSWQNSKQSSEQVEEMPIVPGLTLGNTPEAFLPQNRFSGSSISLTSSVATLMLSSRNISTLPLSSYTLGEPAPVRLGFPSAKALEELLNKHPGVDVQITGLAFNPFQDFDETNIVGSIGNVLLSSNRKLLQLHDLMEDIEITLWRNGSMEMHPTSLNVSTDHFVISVNITSFEKSLIVSIEAERPLFLTLYLGFQYQPNHTHFHRMITLPKGQGQDDEEYTWVLSHNRLQYGIGTYYITAVLNKSQDGGQQPATTFSVITAVTQCYFWDSHNSTWTSDGCQVGPRSTLLRTQCLCNHLTYFGSDFFIVPRTVDVKDTVKLFLRVTNNPVGVSLLASLLGLYLLLFIWAWRKDQEDRRKVKVTILADNEPSFQFCYLVQVNTGYRRNASTTAKVVISLYGSEGRSDPHHLWDSQKAVFERGGLDVFLLRTQFSLGALHSLRLWHDNSGASPSWYVSQVTVIDMVAKKKWLFLCKCWLATDLGDCERDRIFLPVSEKELFSFRHLFSSMIVEKLTQDCLWLSVATRHPWSQFSRVQRLTCCAVLLLCNMVTNIMFWKTNSSAARRGEQVGPFAVTWSELWVSVQSAVILFPINLVIGRLFQILQPQDPPPPSPPQASCPSEASLEPLSLKRTEEELKETVGFLLRRNPCLLSECQQHSCAGNISELVNLLSTLVQAHLEGQGCHQQEELSQENAAPENHLHLHCYLLRVLQRLQGALRMLGDSQAAWPWDCFAAASQLQRAQELLEAHIPPTEPGPCRVPTSFPVLSPEEEKSCLPRGLPRGTLYVCWLLLAATSLVTAFFIALYSLDLNKDQATSWVISMILSFLQNIFISQPVKIVFLTLLFSLTLNRRPKFDKEKDQQTKRILALLGTTGKACSSLPGSRNKNDPMYVAPAMNSPVKRPKRILKEKKLLKQTGEILVQILFLALLMTTVYSAQNPNRFYLHQALQKSFSHRFSEIKLIKHFYPWARHTLVPNLYGEYRGKNIDLGDSIVNSGMLLVSQTPFPGAVEHGQSLVVVSSLTSGFVTDGNAFLLGNVQLRQVRIQPRVSPQGKERPSHPDQEDTENYGAHWSPPDTNTTDPDSIWHYQSQETVDKLAASWDSGSGYVMKLGRNISAALRVLQQLEQSHWLDQHTKSLFVEFVVFNANVKLFCAVTLILETNNMGAFSASVRLESLMPLPTSKKNLVCSIIPQVIYYLLICYYTFIQGHQLKQQRWRFFTRKRNILELSVILISFVNLGLDMKRISLHQKSLAQYHSDPDRFINFYEVLKVNSAVIYVVGFLVLLATVQLWNLLHHNHRLQVIGRSLSRAWDEVAGFLLVILILLTGYAIAFNLLFGWSVSDYRTFFSSVVAVVGLLLGIARHEEVIALNPILGSFLILTSVLLMVLVIINLFVSAILMTFAKERKSLKVETALTEVLQQKLSSLLGIQRQQKTQGK